MYGDGVDHQHYHDHRGEIYVYRHDRDRQRRDLFFYDFYVIWMAVKVGIGIRIVKWKKKGIKC